MNGIVIVDKPEGWTSQDVTARLRRVFQTRRIGHGGTLDPMATGVLPVFVGRATRGVEFFEHAEKTYETVLLLGKTTDTEDVTGNVLTQQQVQMDTLDVEGVLERFRGEILQVPPMYSALKVNGQKLCDLARKGREVERKPRPVTIHQLELLEQGETTLRLRVRCSKGTYIRTLCKDIGQRLGCGGCMASLRRTRAGAYTLADSVPLERLLEESEAGMEVEHYLMPIDSMFLAHPSLALTPTQERRCRNGNAFPARVSDGTWRVYGESGEFLALCQAKDGVMSTVKSFFEVT